MYSLEFEPVRRGLVQLAPGVSRETAAVFHAKLWGRGPNWRSALVSTRIRRLGSRETLVSRETPVSSERLASRATLASLENLGHVYRQRQPARLLRHPAGGETNW